MTATQNVAAPLPQTVDTYLGFEIRQMADDSFVAIPTGWSHRDIAVIEAADMPTMRKRIWSWWHRFLD